MAVLQTTPLNTMESLTTFFKRGETKAGVMKKFSAPKTSVRPKTRPSAGISANTKKKIEETVKKK